MRFQKILLAVSLIIIFSLSSCDLVQTMMQGFQTNADSSPTGTPPHMTVQAKSFSELPTLSPNDPSVLFFDDFSDNYSGWEGKSAADGSMGYSGGSYSIVVNEADYCHWSLNSKTFSDVAIQVDTKMIRSAANDEFGVICRLKDSDNFYTAGITIDGYYGISKQSKGEWIDLGGDKWGFNDRVIKTGSLTNRLKFTCDYDKLTLEVNGTELVSVIDPDIRTGDVGLYVCAYDEPGAEVLFDNFVVIKP